MLVGVADLRLGALLLKAQILSPAQLQEAEAEQIRTGVRLGQIVVERGWVRERSFYDALAKAARIRRLDLATVRTDRRAIRAVDSIWALDHGMVPLFVDGAQRTLEVAVTDPTVREPLVELEQKTGLAVVPILGSEGEIGQLIRHQFFEEPLDGRPEALSEAPTEGRPAAQPPQSPRLRSPHEAEAGAPAWGNPPSHPTQPPAWGNPSTQPGPAQAAGQPASWGNPSTQPGPAQAAQQAPNWGNPSTLAGTKAVPGAPSWGNPPTASGARDAQDAELLNQLRPVFEGHQENARILQAVFELCVRRGVITREEYLRRLAAADD
ncbi:MAG: hypothetical protein RKU31_36065 [Deltaproteobacteria bacterium]|jgi:hypothetical protein